MRYQPISSQLFTDRRNSFARRMKRNTMAIFYSNEVMVKTADQMHSFRQNSSLFALSGLDQPGSILVLFPDAKQANRKEMAFILPQDPEHTIWNGDRMTPTLASDISGIRSVYASDQWDKIITPLVKMVKGIYTNTSDKVETQERSLCLNDHMHHLLRKGYPSLSFFDAKPILQDLRMIKHPLEIDLIRKAIEITSAAFDNVLRTIKPGQKEFEVEAELTYIITKHGGQHAFEPIVASGSSACILHYIRNDRPMGENDLVLIDFGAAYANMSSDMTRTIPVSGVFTKRQRQIYKSVQIILEEITSLMRPGITPKQLNEATGELIDRELINLKIITTRELNRQDPASPLRRKYFMHGVSHHMGYDVHDPSDRLAPLKSGMVLTCEPGLYIPEENIGIRLENDILITRGKPINLMADVPIDPDEIEAMMK